MYYGVGAVDELRALRAEGVDLAAGVRVEHVDVVGLADGRADVSRHVE